jgi:hypothetical protein
VWEERRNTEEAGLRLKADGGSVRGGYLSVLCSVMYIHFSAAYLVTYNSLSFLLWKLLVGPGYGVTHSAVTRGTFALRWTEAGGSTVTLGDGGNHL